MTKEENLSAVGDTVVPFSSCSASLSVDDFVLPLSAAGALLAHAKQIQPSDPPQVEMTRNLNTSCHPEDIKQGVNDECNISLSDHQWNESGIPETAAKQQYNLQQDTMHLFLIFQGAKCSPWKKRRSKLAKFEGKHLLGYIGVPQVNSYPWIV